MMTGIVATGAGIGTLIAPPVANRLIFAYDWRLSYIILGSIVLVVVVSAAQFLRRDPIKIRQLPFGQSSEREQESKSATSGFSFGQAVHTRQFWQLSAMSFCFGFTMFAVMVHIVPHATDLGVAPTSAANILVVIGALDIVSRIVMGSAADRIGNRLAFIIGFALMSVALLWLATAKEVWMLYPLAAVFGFAYSTIGTSVLPLVARLFGLKSLGLVSGIIVLGFQVGGTVGPLFVGYMFDANNSYEMAFLVCAAIGLVGLMLTVLLRPIGAKTSIQEAPIRL